MNTTDMHIPSNRVRDIERYFLSELEGLYPPEEIHMFVRLLFEAYLEWDLSALLLHRDSTINQSDLLRFHWAAEDLKRQRPIQHIIGHCEFCDCRIEVSPDVLIPRPETAEIVAWIVANRHSNPPQRIADLCTGSGCIAIALKQQFRQAYVSAIDISAAAISVAQRNATANKAEIHFTECDLLNNDPLTGYYDLIVSNPPYIRHSEQKKMHTNVIDYEPALALFVPDDTPLLFYRRIGKIAQEHLTSGGELVLEINETLSTETCALLNEMGYSTSLHHDFNGKPRMIVAHQGS